MSSIEARQAEDRPDTVKDCEPFEVILEDGDLVRVNRRPGVEEFLQELSGSLEAG
eukprot:CAMPEP_0113944370 /NCGR_PEP_ID=MMETSP1339-20121228/34014_1 /TAXON_ID=94617 /ORGANISM="Fibrocapsa japonica" /LENGTH=54 /DNA_ID=CAMNT_0000949557 /DNA_START=182 /DNA_END=342 /DNA_ORIENTATION=+ /assembly_acc=CAM_ASM_000762